MSETKPLKRHPALIELSKDHHFGLLLSWKIRKGEELLIDTDRVADYVIYFFEQDLEYHFHEEEEILFPRLKQNDPLRIQAENEHSEIRELIQQIKADKNFVRLKEFARLLDNHIRFEERILFDHIQKIFTPETLQTIADELKERERPVPEVWTDNFWIERKKEN